MTFLSNASYPINLYCHFFFLLGAVKEDGDHLGHSTFSYEIRDGVGTTSVNPIDMH